MKPIRQIKLVIVSGKAEVVVGDLKRFCYRMRNEDEEGERL